MNWPHDYLSISMRSICINNCNNKHFILHSFHLLSYLENLGIYCILMTWALLLSLPKKIQQDIEITMYWYTLMFVFFQYNNKMCWVGRVHQQRPCSLRWCRQCCRWALSNRQLRAWFSLASCSPATITLLYLTWCLTFCRPKQRGGRAVIITPVHKKIQHGLSYLILYK